MEDVGVVFGSDTDLALGLSFGMAVSDDARVEAELTHTAVVWDVGAGGDVSGDGFMVGVNALYDIDLSPVTLETGLGLGWAFFDDACFEVGGGRRCVDADFDDWTMQGILGVSYDISKSNAVVVRYRMQNVGGFTAEDRLHVFTVGFRHFL